MTQRLALALSALALGGCAATAPFSQVTGQLISRTDMNTYPTIVLSVDGVSTYMDPTTITPGVRTLRIQASSGTWFGEFQEFKLDAQPCVRYYIAAYRPSPVLPAFEVRINGELPLSGCPLTDVKK